MQEQVLVVRTPDIDPLLGRPFCSEKCERVMEHILSSHVFLTRDLAEHDPSFKQVIPYVLVRHKNKFLLLRRTAGQTEKRLHHKFSLGVGGHINPEPSLGRHANIVEAGMHRELSEEVQVGGHHRIKMLGTINDDSTEVSRVHLGLVFLLETDTAEFNVNEKDLMTAEWAEVRRIASVYNELESWSQILFDHCIRQKKNGKES